MTVGQHDHALEILEKISNSLFFQIDLTHNVLFSLAPERLSVRSTRTTPKQRTSIEFPRTEFDKAPLSLYFYGRNADGMPLLRFLAYYQVIEFYFPVYSRAEAQRRVREIIKSPAFRADRDTDVARILAATRTATHAGDERAQLRATINECVDPATLREFFAESARKEFFALRGKKALTKRAIIVKEGDGESADLRSDVAERIYEIRCKIVHTKGQAGDPDLELLLPYSAEAQMLQHDIDLVQLVARSVLISASTAMTLATPSGNQE